MTGVRLPLRLAIGLLCLLFACHGICADPLSSEFKAAFGQRLQERTAKLIENGDEATFRAVCGKLSESLSKIPDDTALTTTTAIVRAVRNTLTATFDDPSLALTPTSRDAWKKLGTQIVDQYEGDDGISGFDSDDAKAWKALVVLFADSLKTVASESKEAEKPTDFDELLGEDVTKKAAPRGLEVGLYDKLEDLGVVYHDSRFRFTCREMSQFLDANLASLARRHASDVKAFKRSVVAELWKIAKSNTEGDEKAAERWKNGVTLIINGLGDEIVDAQATRAEPTVEEWHLAFQRLSRGLKKAIDADVAKYKQPKGGFAGSSDSSNASGGSSYGGSIHHVWHERKMSHIEHTHQRRMYRIERIRAR